MRTNFKRLKSDRIISKVNSTGINGVSLRKDGRYYVRIGHNGRSYYLGSYDDLEEARTIRSAAAANVRGDFDEWYYNKILL